MTFTVALNRPGARPAGYPGAGSEAELVGIARIDRWASMSNMKHDSLVSSGIEIKERVLRTNLAEAQPDIYVKGGDYTLETVNQEERRTVEGAGGKIVILPVVPGKSTTALVEKLRRNAETAEVPLMFLSSDTSVECKVRGLELGVAERLAVRVPLGGQAVEVPAQHLDVGRLVIRRRPRQIGQPVLAGGKEAFVTRLDGGGSTLLYSTFLGGTGADAGTTTSMATASRSATSASASCRPWPMRPRWKLPAGGALAVDRDGFAGAISPPPARDPRSGRSPRHRGGATA